MNSLTLFEVAPWVMNLISITILVAVFVVPAEQSHKVMMGFNFWFYFVSNVMASVLLLSIWFAIIHKTVDFLISPVSLNHVITI